MHQVSRTNTSTQRIKISAQQVPRTQHATSFMNKISFAWRKINVQVSLRENQNAISFTKKSTLNKFHVQKSACDNFNEQNQFHKEKNQWNKFHKEKIRHTRSFTNKNQHAKSPTKKFSTPQVP